MISAEVVHYAANLVRKTMIDSYNIKFDSSSPGAIMKHTKADLKENLVLVQKRYWIILVLRRLYLESKGYK